MLASSCRWRTPGEIWGRCNVLIRGMAMVSCRADTGGAGCCWGAFQRHRTLHLTLAPYAGMKKAGGTRGFTSMQLEVPWRK